MGSNILLVAAELLTVPQSSGLELTPCARWFVCTSSRQPRRSAGHDRVKFVPLTLFVSMGAFVFTGAAGNTANCTAEPVFSNAAVRPDATDTGPSWKPVKPLVPPSEV